MKLSLLQLLTFNVVVRNIKDEKISNKLAYAMTKNKEKMRADFEGIVAAEKELIDINDERNTYIKKNGARNINGEFEVSSDDAGLLEISAKYDAAKNKHIEFLKTETEVEIHKVKIEDMPEKVSQSDIEALMFMIE